MSVSYNRLWKQLIDKNMKRIEMQHLTGIIVRQVYIAALHKEQQQIAEAVEKAERGDDS